MASSDAKRAYDRAYYLRNREKAIARAAARKTRKPCARCGGPKEPGRRRQWCDGCREAARRKCSRCGEAVAPKCRYCASCRDAVKAARKRAEHRRDYAKNRERRLAANAAWGAANPERIREYQHRAQGNRRAAKLAPGAERIDPLVVLESADGVCGICGEDVDPTSFHVDHVIPLARGGEHAYHNVQPAHSVCNIRKGASL